MYSTNNIILYPPGDTKANYKEDVKYYDFKWASTN